MSLTIGVAMNAFKGSLSALDATKAVQNGLEQSQLACQTIALPLADGGDDTLAVMMTAAYSRTYTISVENALGETVEAKYGILTDGNIAVIEMALASGLAMLDGKTDALRASTYGTGQLMQHAINQGVQKIIVGVGGSATTDGGAGCLQALGIELINQNSDALQRGGGALSDLAQVMPKRIPCEVLVLCDVENPPLGEKGAAAIFAPQKGATREQVAQLEQNLSHYFEVIATQTGRDVRKLAGGGAAGALAGGLAALANAKLVPGAQTIIETLGYEEKVATCDLIITGEGQLDAQTQHGKAPAVIATLAQNYNIPTIALAGSVPSPKTLSESPIHAAFSLMPRPAPLADAVQHADVWLQNLAEHVGNVLGLRIF